MTAIAPVGPPKFGMSEAAKARGLDKPTVLRSIESGRLSAMRSMRDALGQRQIEPAEFHRVYSPADTVHSKTLQITSRHFVEIAVTNELNGFALFERHRTHDPESWQFVPPTPPRASMACAGPGAIRPPRLTLTRSLMKPPTL
jgi:hypothetical protein